MDQETFLSLSPADMQQYYNHSFVQVKLPDASDFQWCGIGGFTGGPGLQVVLQTADGNITLPVAKHGLKWDFSIPPAGIYNFKNSVVIFHRKPLRHPTKGLTPNNAHFANFGAALTALGVIPTELFSANAFGLTSANLNLLFKQSQPISFSRGLERIEKKQVFAHALNSRICISQGIMSKHPSLWLREKIIGEVNLAKGTAWPIHDAFRQELLDTFQGTGIHIK